jgi:hypothetical protein
VVVIKRALPTAEFGKPLGLRLRVKMKMNIYQKEPKFAPEPGDSL